MTSEQLKATHKLIKQLDAQYHFEKIIPHKDASATSCPGKHLIFQLKIFWRGDQESVDSRTVAAPTIQQGDDLGIWTITRYYTPLPDQPYFYRDTYEQDFKINCQGDCFVTASGYRLQPEDAKRAVACPPELPFGTRLHIEGYGEVVCRDRGGAIKGQRLDLWAGSGTDAVDWIKKTSNQGGQRRVHKL